MHPMAGIQMKTFRQFFLFLSLMMMGGVFTLISHTVTERVSQAIKPTPVDANTMSDVTMRKIRHYESNIVLPVCLATPPGLLGRVNVIESVSMSDVEARQREVVRAGGRWWPEECEARWRLAVIVPYRDRPHQIGPFLNHMHPFLQRQQLNYTIYFVEQAGNDPFNRARLLNVGFLEAVKKGPWDCYAFHDVDMLPENDHHLYHCSPQPRHLAVATSIQAYRDSGKARTNDYYGGACLMTEQHIRKVNGWSNVYWGWGAEDNDMRERIAFMNMRVWRYPGEVASYRMVQHKPEAKNADRYEILANGTSRIHWDGISNLNYTVIRTSTLPLYTHILANIGPAPQVNLVSAEDPRKGLFARKRTRQHQPGHQKG